MFSFVERIRLLEKHETFFRGALWVLLRGRDETGQGPVSHPSQGELKNTFFVAFIVDQFIQRNLNVKLFQLIRR